VSWTIGRDEVTIVIRDEGSGFVRPSADVSPDAVDFDTVFGRGVLIMQTFMDEVLYNASGNEVTLIKRSAPPAPIEPAETAD
jgi:anti-sigma regulatory factor (Ser/Thr protein kinase)